VLDDPVAITALQRLRTLGVAVALDDFGTAASSLGLLLTCPVTTLKLDRTFVDRITTVSRQEAVATAVIRMARRSTSTRWPRASRRPSRRRCCAGSDTGTARATCTRRRWLPGRWPNACRRPLVRSAEALQHL
jgi:hypothetical protein